jgi:hypothetical protein
VEENDIVVDAGTAEGNFALSVVEKVKKLYLFEADEEWIEVLKVTFAPWQEKVEIICNYVSDIDDRDNNHITLDTFFKNEQMNFLKADVEGAALNLLKGYQKYITVNDKLKIALATYHYQNEAEVIDTYLRNMGFNNEFSRGYMIYTYDKTLDAPYLRKGLIRSVKSQ